MNKIYRKVWSSKLGAYIAVSEAAKSRTKCGGLVAGAVMCLSLAGTNAFAQVTTNWVTWNLPSSYPLPSVAQPSSGFSYATGATGSVVDPLSGKTIGVTLSGEVNQYSGAWYNGG